jgi:hypothetical protein
MTNAIWVFGGRNEKDEGHFVVILWLFCGYFVIN